MDSYNPDYIKQMEKSVKKNMETIKEITVAIHQCNENFKAINESCEKIITEIENREKKK